MDSNWRCLAALTLARAAMGFQFQSIAAVAPLVGDDIGLDKTQLGWLTGLYLLPGIALALFMESSCGASVSDRASRATITRKDYAARILAPRRPRGCSWSGNRETLFPFSMRYAARSCPSRSSRSGRENRGTRSDSLWDS